MDIDPTTTKYMIHATITAEGVIKKPDVVGAVFGQTEGLLGDELDLRDLQRSNRMGRIEVDVKSVNGKTEGTITMPSSLNKVETAILAAALETIERIGPCLSKITVTKIDDVRVTKREVIVERAKVFLQDMTSASSSLGGDLTDSVRKAVQIEEIISWGKGEHPAGPNIDSSDAIIIVEGRSDVLNLLKYGIKNTIAVGGTNIPDDIKELTKARIVTAFVDGDRGGDLIIAELLQTAEVDFICKAPPNTEVEELTQKQVMKCLRSKIPTEQYIEMFDLDKELKTDSPLVQKKLEAAKKEKTGAARKVQKRAKENLPKGRTGRARPVPERRELRPPRRSEEAPRKRLVLSEKIMKTISSIEELQNAGKGYFFDANESTLREVSASDLISALGEADKDTVDTIVFGRLITQRLVDTAFEKGVKKIVGFKTHNITKIPGSLQVLTQVNDK